MSAILNEPDFQARRQVRQKVHDSDNRMKWEDVNEVIEGGEVVHEDAGADYAIVEGTAFVPQETRVRLHISINTATGDAINKMEILS